MQDAQTGVFRSRGTYPRSNEGSGTTVPVFLAIEEQPTPTNQPCTQRQQHLLSFEQTPPQCY
eukprot:jgi/Psemu1/302680/fgenesh1_kg.77_\